jgi:hypothetical protein
MRIPRTWLFLLFIGGSVTPLFADPSSCLLMTKLADVVPGPSYEDIESHLYASHAFSKPPVNGALEAAEERGTMHFALGSLVPKHGYSDWGDWQKFPYVLVTPFKRIQDRTLNLNTYDTFMLGDYKLQPGDIIIGPSANRHLFPDFVTYQSAAMDSKHNAVAQAIKDAGGWVFEMENGKLEGAAMLDGKNVNLPAFFKPVLDKHPYISFGTHSSSMQGDAARWGMIDEFATAAKSSNGSSTDEWNFYRMLLANHLQKLDKKFASPGVPEALKTAFATERPRLEGNLKIYDLDLEFRRKYGWQMENKMRAALFKTAMENPTDLDTQLKKAQDFVATAFHKVPKGKRQDFDAIKEAARGQMIRSEDGGSVKLSKYTVKALPQLLASLPKDEVFGLMKANPQAFAPVNQADFTLNYAMSRTMLIGFDRAKEEGLLQSAAEAFHTLAAQRKNMKPILEAAKASRVVMSDGRTIFGEKDLGPMFKDFGREEDFERLNAWLKDLAKSGAH